jgi:hypothetical protein
MLGRSIVNTVRLENIAATLPPDSHRRLAQLYPDGECWIWGLTPGPQNQRVWDRLTAGDDVAFFAGGSIRFYMRITHKEHNRELAEQVWGIRERHRHGDNKTFELTYFSARPQIVELSLEQFNGLTGYHLRRMPQNAYIIDADRANRIRDALAIQLSDLAAILETAPNGEGLLEDIIAPISAPPIRPYSPTPQKEWTTDGKWADPFTMLKNRERRSQAHQSLLDEVWSKRTEGVTAEESDLVDLLLNGQIFVEIKSVLDDVLRQVRAALAQLYHYRFVYRHDYPSPILLAIFGEKPIHRGEDLSDFLTACGIASAWKSEVGSFEGTPEARTTLPWLMD